MISINKNAVEAFKTRWAGRGDEKSDTQKFWLELLRYVCVVEQSETLIDYEKRVELKHKSFIDAYIPSTRVLIEQKSFDVDLSKQIKNSDGSYLTPFEQAKRYYDWLPASERGRWIVICNFKEFWIYDIETPRAKSEIIELANLDKEFNKLAFLVEANAQGPKEIRELEISVKAGELVKMLYEAVKPRYINSDSPEALRSLNIFCVRIVFLLYAEDSGLFNKAAFHDYLKANSHDARQALLNLFKILSQPESERDVYINDELKAFPYVNGGLFEDIQIEIPKLNKPDDEPLRIILEDMSNGFDWSNI